MLSPEQSLTEASLGFIPGTGFGIHVDGGAPLIGPPAAASTVGAVDLQSQSVPGQFLGSGPSPFKETPAVFELRSYFGISSCSTGEEIFRLRLQEEKVVRLQLIDILILDPLLQSLSLHGSEATKHGRRSILPDGEEGLVPEVLATGILVFLSQETRTLESIQP